jgi:hypothetical protein
MAAFHRFVDPAYEGAPTLPTGPATVTFNGVPYNRLNVTSGGTGTGGSAFADGSKVGGPNVGSYLVAFGEDATSSNANRGIRALAENTDYLDDLMNRPIALPVRTALATASGSVFSIALPAGTFVGNTGAYPLDMLFSITDENDNEIITSAGVKVQVVSISGASVGSGFSAGTVTCTINPGIPTGTQYRMTYAQRSSLGTLPPDALSFIRIRGAEEVSASVEQVFRTIQSPPAINLAWNAAPQSTLWDLSASGLNERYRRATSTAGSPTFNGAGAGAIITRDGVAPTSRALTNFGDRNVYDPWQALWYADDVAQGGALSGASGGLGSVGFLSRTNRAFLRGEVTNNAANRGTSLGSFAEYVERQQVVIGTSPSTGAGYSTKILKGTAATIGPGGAPGSFTVTLSAGNFFWANNLAAQKETAVQPGRDILVVTVGAERVALTITALDSGTATVCTVTTPDLGIIPQLATAQVGSVACTVTWYSARFHIGHNAARVKSNLDALSGQTVSASVPRDGGLFLVDPPRGLTSDVTDVSSAYKSYSNNSEPTAYFGRAGLVPGPETVVAWGAFSPFLSGTPGWTQAGKLLSDGVAIVAGLSATNNAVPASNTAQIAGPFISADSNPGISTGRGAVRTRGLVQVGPEIAGEFNPGIVRAMRYSRIPGIGERRVRKLTSSGTSYTLDLMPGTGTVPTIASFSSPTGHAVPSSFYFVFEKDNAASTLSLTYQLPWGLDYAVGDDVDIVLVGRGADFTLTLNTGANGDGVFGRDVTVGGITYRNQIIGAGSLLQMTSGVGNAGCYSILKFRVVYVDRVGASPRRMGWSLVTAVQANNTSSATMLAFGSDGCEVG